MQITKNVFSNMLVVCFIALLSFCIKVDAAPIGYLDYANETTVCGWVYGNDGEQIVVDVYVDGVLDGREVADTLRTDVQNAGYGSGEYGYNYKINWTLYSPGIHTVSVYAIDYDTNPLLGTIQYNYVAPIVNPNAFYTLKNVATGLGASVDGLSQANEAAIIQYRSISGLDGELNEQFQFVPTGDGYYSIVARHSGKCLQTSMNANNGAGINQYQYAGALWQQWSVESLGGTKIIIRNRYSNKVLQVPSNTSPSSTQLNQWDYIGYNWQQWDLGLCVDKNQQFIIRNANDSRVIDLWGFNLNNEASIAKCDYANGDNQKYDIVPVYDGYYAIINRYSGKCIQIPCSNDNYAPVTQYDYVGVPWQQWSFEPVGDGTYYIKNRYSGKVIDGGMSTGSGTGLFQWDKSNVQWHKWRIIPISENLTLKDKYHLYNKANGAKLHNTNEYYLGNPQYNNVCSVAFYSTDLSQDWKFIGSGPEGQFKIINSRTGLAIHLTQEGYMGRTDVFNIAMVPSQECWQQYWELQLEDDGTYSIVNSENGYKLHRTGEAYNGAGTFNIVAVPGDWASDDNRWFID